MNEDSYPSTINIMNSLRDFGVPDKISPKITYLGLSPGAEN